MNLRIARAEIEDFLTKIGITEFDVNEDALKDEDPYLAITTSFTYEDLNDANIDLTIICDEGMSVSFEFYGVEDREETLELLNTINGTFDVLKMYINDNNNVELVFDYLKVSIDELESYLHHTFDFLSNEKFVGYYEELYELFE